MTPAEAGAHLHEQGYRLAPGPTLTSEPGAEYANSTWGGGSILLDGLFTATDLDAFAVWIRQQPFVAIEMERIADRSEA